MPRAPTAHLRPPPPQIVVSEGDDSFDKNAHIAEVLASIAAQEEYDNTDAAGDAQIMESIKYPDAAVAAAAMSK